MKKQGGWRFFLILSVMILTFYHILPTICYYSKSLKSPIQEADAKKIAASIETRVSNLEKESIEWLSSFCDLIHVKADSIVPTSENLLIVSFAKTDEARRFRSLLPRAGALIPFAPARLTLPPQDTLSKEVIVQRGVPVRLESEAFSFAEKNTPFYQEIIAERTKILATLLSESPADFKTSPVQVLSHPLFSELSIDWSQEKIQLKLRDQISPTQQSVIDELARLSNESNEKILPETGGYQIPFHQQSHASGYIVLKLKNVAEKWSLSLLSTLKSRFHPHHPDFQHLPIVTAKDFASLAPEERSFCLLISPDRVEIKGVERIIRNYEARPESPMATQFSEDFRTLRDLLSAYGFSSGSLSSDGDFLFQGSNFLRPLLAATRENMLLRGDYALLEVSDLEQRLIVENKIDDQIHADLLKWEEEYQAAKVSLNLHVAFDVPKPTRSAFWNNISLSLRKLFRGDEKKILRWGLDLSGGKSVQIELRDAAGELVTTEAELKQGVNELYARVNKMGVSEVSIRQMGENIVLDFPGSQAFSASELIRASTMHFHVVNERFSPQNPELGELVDRFLQEVWNQAVVTGKKDLKSLQTMAYERLQSESGRLLKDRGLQLQNPSDHTISSSLDETISKIALYRGENREGWYGQRHPLLIVFRNFALEGSQLENIHAGYDPSKGNFLSFSIASSSDISNWSSCFAKEAVIARGEEKCSHGQGWRMAAILNDTVISAPTLNEPLRDSAMISGHFSQGEVTQLAADLKAGSLTFTPHILSEKNVSPELGKTDRVKGIVATIVALALVVAAMVGYYRFAGVVASVAVLFNLLILWATLQNLGAALSLAGIAGIILTVGMAVDANVLVFERVKEEFAISKNISSALHKGYQKAYSAIVDSNVTTIIAALILLNFDAGPIKSFAINLIIGIASSMFTALFMTRFYFSRWVENPKPRVLNMGNWIRSTSFDFLKMAKPSFLIATAIILFGSALAFAQKSTIFGMDFTGGYSLELAIEPLEGHRELTAVEEALRKAGMSPQNFQVRELYPSNHLRLLFGARENLQLESITTALQSSGVKILPESLSTLETTWTAMSGQMSDTMRNNALLGLAIAFACIFVYLTIRFEYKFAAAALICLFHDVLVTFGCMGLLHALGVNLQIDLSTVAALMTIIGYSLNDTIIIFDRIREETALFPRKSMREIVNASLNATLSRTTITSGTTLLVLLALVALGGSSIFSFSLVMTIGVFLGTLSSWLIAAPLLLWFQKREELVRT